MFFFFFFSFLGQRFQGFSFSVFFFKVLSLFQGFFITLEFKGLGDFEGIKVFIQIFYGLCFLCFGVFGLFEVYFGGFLKVLDFFQNFKIFQCFWVLQVFFKVFRNILCFMFLFLRLLVFFQCLRFFQNILLWILGFIFRI